MGVWALRVVGVLAGLFGMLLLFGLGVLVWDLWLCHVFSAVPIGHDTYFLTIPGIGTFEADEPPFKFILVCFFFLVLFCLWASVWCLMRKLKPKTSVPT